MRTKCVTLVVAAILFLAASQIGIVQGETAYISNVPFHKQEQSYWCRPNVLKMGLEFWGINQNQTEIASVVYDHEGKVTTMFALKNYTRNLGFNNTDFTGSIPQLKNCINQGFARDCVAENLHNQPIRTLQSSGWLRR
jgi:hypothetical protein